MRVRASFLAAMTLFAASALVPAELAYAEVKIGAAGPLTGKYAWYGEQLLLRVQTAVAELNARGGVLGQQVQIVQGVDDCDAEQGIAVARKLIADGVLFVSGHF